MHYLGIDVAKAKLECSLLIDVDQHTRKSTSVAHSPAGIADVLTWISPHTLHPAQRHAVMEAPGVYHERAAATVHDAGVTVSIAKWLSTQGN